MSYRIRAIERRRVSAMATSDSKSGWDSRNPRVYGVNIGSAGVVIRNMVERYLADDCFQIMASKPT